MMPNHSAGVDAGFPLAWHRGVFSPGTTQHRRYTASATKGVVVRPYQCNYQI